MGHKWTQKELQNYIAREEEVAQRPITSWDDMDEYIYIDGGYKIQLDGYFTMNALRFILENFEEERAKAHEEWLSEIEMEVRND